ncbi:superoxide dismutase [Candidatus Woesearchaeota archaeon]|nr:superoxide dismutase [Candidatus Woesearchaeota archaeon]
MHTLPKLPYEYNALEPHIDELTMRLHHTKHHQAYIDKLNAAIKGTKFEKIDINAVLKNINEVPENIRTVVRNHGGGHSNHSFFWTIMSPDGGGEPSGEVGDAIKQTFGGFEKFKEIFAEAAMSRFGSGWAWLILQNGKLAVTSTANQDTPISEGKTPVLGLDLWEHSYYKKYGPSRADYIKVWWNVVDWEQVNKLFENIK